MATYYLDLVNGNDSADGSTFALGGLPTVGPWLTITGGATAARIAPGDTIRIAKTGDPVSAGVNGTFTNASKTVTLSAAVTATIDNCESAWTAANSATTAYWNTRKEGATSTSITAPVSPSTSTLYAYYQISDTDFSSYTKISFWLYNQSVLLATDWKICLCSDTAGTTIVDTFELPAIASVTHWLPLTITKTGGGNLGSSIQSIALYSNTTAPTGSTYLRLDNIFACNGLSLQSLIGKSSTATWQSEAWYTIQSIDGTTLLIDNDPQTLATAGQGYSGTSETVALYYRETFKTALATSSINQVSVINDSGTLGNPITFSGGWNTSTTEQDGMTFMDGLNGYGYNLYAASKSNVIIDSIATCRYYRCYFSEIHDFTISNIYCIGMNTYGLNLTGGYKNYISNSISNSNSNYGIYCTDFNDLFSNCYVHSNLSYNVYASQFIKFINLICSNTAYRDLFNDNVQIYLINSSLLSTTEITFNSKNGIIKSLWHDQTEGNNWVFEDEATANWQTTTKNGTEPGAWKSAITGTSRTTDNPFKLKVAEIACEASTQVTVSAYVKKDHATNVGCKLIVYEDNLFITGVSADTLSDTKADDTNWEELSISFTPEYDSVIPVYLESWYSAGTSNTYIGTLTISTA